MLTIKHLNSPILFINMSRRRKNGKARKASVTTQSQVNNNSNAQINASETNVTQPAVVQEVIAPDENDKKLIKRAYELDPEWKISVIAKRKFMSLPTALQNGAGKEACVKQALASHKEIIPDPERYWIWLIDETEKLTRVWDFAEVCKKYGRTPLTVAQHLIIEGKMVCNSIRMDGLASYGSKIAMFIEPLFVDEFKLFEDKFKIEKEDAHE